MIRAGNYAGFWLGCAVLAIAAYLDSIRGPILPALISEFSVSFKSASMVLVVGNISAFLFTMVFDVLVKRVGVWRASGIASIFGLVVVVLPPFVGSFTSLLWIAALLGMAVALLGAACNVLVVSGSDSDQRAMFLCWLHSLYGVGCMVSPIFVASFLRFGLDWRWLFVVVVPPLSLVAYWLLRMQEPREVAVTEQLLEPKNTRWLGRQEWFAISIFAIYVAGEVSFSMWMVTYLVDVKGWSTSVAAPYLSGFFAVMVLSRAGAGFLIKRSDYAKWLYGSLVCALLFFGLFFWTREAWFLPLVGLVGPFFPVMMATVAELFPKTWSTVTISMVTVMQLTLALVHLFLGSVADVVGIRWAYVSPWMLFLVALGLLMVFFRSRSHRFTL